MGNNIDSLRERWRRLKSSSSFRDFMLFLVFVGISTLFWLILALNDSAQDSFNVKLNVANCPDSVTFIDELPPRIHVTVRDKGNNLWRNHYRHPSININFRDYSSDGILKFSHNDIQSALKSIFGQSAQILSVSCDSIQLNYTANPGKRVPVIIRENVYAASGSTIEGLLKPKPSNVLVYGDINIIDTIHKVFSDVISMRNLTETTTVEVNLQKIRGVRIIPSSVSVTIPVEPLVKKNAQITVSTVNVPAGESLLIFPSKVPVEYYVAMSRLNNDDDPDIELIVDYNETMISQSGRLHVEVSQYPDRLKNLSILNDSVEYTIVKN